MVKKDISMLIHQLISKRQNAIQPAILAHFSLFSQTLHHRAVIK
jgi:hypothetical protein